MMTTDKEKSRQRTRMLAELREQHRESVKAAQAMLKEQQTARKSISRAIQGGPKSVPQIAEITGMPPHEVLWYVAAMKKYGQIVEDGLDDDYEYYLYRLAKEA
jgi:predicted Rossmann fold nucleotide-binding protein DprA/Smf involved in DNA uptake